MGEAVRIGIARDSAFGFYYPGDLQTFAQQGAEIVPIDMQRDTALPPLDGLFIGGGFPETQMAALSANHALHESLRNAVEAGLPVYAECGGLMYLTRSIEWEGEQYPMAGIIPADTRMHPKPIGKGYIRIQPTPSHPWGWQSETDIGGHEFHYSEIQGLPHDAPFAFRVARGTGIDGQHDGYVYKNLLACYAHMRHVDAHPWVTHFLAFVRQVKAQHSGNRVAS